MEISSQVTQLVQLSIAPVFLLTSVAAFLAVLMNRLSRIVDRVRKLEASDHNMPRSQMELHILFKRIRLINMAISLFTAAALLICLLIGLLFIGNFFELSKASYIATLFIGTMSCLIFGLVLLQAEIYLAIKVMRLNYE